MHGMRDNQKLRFVSIQSAALPSGTTVISAYRVWQGRRELGLVAQYASHGGKLRWHAWDASDQPVGPVALGFPTRKAAVAKLEAHYA